MPFIKMGPRQCGVCKDAQSKYKCPSCEVLYCSLGCYKSHKGDNCTKSSPAVQKKENMVIHELMVLHERLYGPDEANWILSKEKLLSVQKSDEIRNALADAELRNLILQITCSQDPENELDKAGEGQAFRIFQDKILDIVSPQD